MVSQRLVAIGTPVCRGSNSSFNVLRVIHLIRGLLQKKGHETLCPLDQNSYERRDLCGKTEDNSRRRVLDLCSVTVQILVLTLTTDERSITSDDSPRNHPRHYEYDSILR